jgi:hypothetical protein
VKKRVIRFEVLGIEWKAKFLKTTAYISRFDPETAAHCEVKDKTIYFCIEDFNEEVALHELTHAFLEETSFNSLTLTSDQKEEFFCEMVGKHGRKMVSLGTFIYASFVGV